MASYVVVNAEDENDKVIKDGPLALDNESQHDPGEGCRVMPETEALAAGYTYVDDSADDEQQGVQGVQGQEGGQGAQVQPGVQDTRNQ
jgi:hypothetical protein